MDGRSETLAEQLGRLLQDERQKRGLTQRDLASRAAVAQQQLSRFERGEVGTTTRLADRLFAELGLQVRVEVEAAGGGLEVEIETTRARLADRQALLLADLRLLSVRGKPGFDYVFDGEGAALLQGVPVAAPRVALMVPRAQVEALAEWILRGGARRWDERARDFGWGDPDPREPGPLRWRNGLAEVAVRLVERLPLPVLVTLPESGEGDQHRVAVRALTDVEADFPAVARVLSRLRAR